MLGIQHVPKRLGHDLRRTHPALLNLRQHLTTLSLHFSGLEAWVLQDIRQQVKTALHILRQECQRGRAARAASAGIEARPQEIDLISDVGGAPLHRALIQETSRQIGESSLILWIMRRTYLDAHADMHDGKL